MDKSDVKTKEDLIVWLDTNGEGIPFLPRLWDICVEKADENIGKEQPMKTTIVEDKNGNKEVKRKKGGVLITNPISFYFRLYKLPQYKKEALALLEDEELTDSQKEVMETYFDEVDEEGNFNEIIQWINMFPNVKERQFLKQKYSYYYDNYEINDGADRTMLSGILSLEIELYRINTKRAQGKPTDIIREEKLRKMLRESLEAQKWTKKQRSAVDEMAQNKFTIWMDKQCSNGRFSPESHEIPKDEIDMLIEIIPQAVARMFD